MGPMKYDGAAHTRSKMKVKQGERNTDTPAGGESTGDRANTGTRAVLKTGSGPRTPSGTDAGGPSGLMRGDPGRKA